MRELRITPWRIESLNPDDRSFRESIFSQGNGYMGTRGYRPDQRGAHPAWRSTFLAGFYEYVKPGILPLRRYTTKNCGFMIWKPINKNKVRI